MYVFSANLSQSIAPLFGEMTRILRQEVAPNLPLKMHRSRFELAETYWPLTLKVLDENDKRWGLFDPHFYTIGIHRTLVDAPMSEFCQNVIRHELLHYLTHILHPEETKPHGPCFQALGEKLGWSEEIRKASSPGLGSLVQQKTAAAEKIAKLLALAESQNIYEAQLALTKAQELMRKHNLTESSTSHEDMEEIVSLTLCQYKRAQSKHSYIAQILNEFDVMAVFHRGQNLGELAIYGRRTDVEVAEHIYAQLDLLFESLWKEEQANAPTELKGLAAKNSFFRGLTLGILSGLSKQEKVMSSKNRSLVKSKQSLLKRQVNAALGRLSYQSTRFKSHSQAQGLGRSRGQDISLKKGIHGDKSRTRFISPPAP